MFQVDPEAQLHQSAQGDLHQRKDQPQEGLIIIDLIFCHLCKKCSGAEAGGEGVVLQAIRPQDLLNKTCS